MSAAPFDPRRVRALRRRAAKAFSQDAFLHERVCQDLAERLEAVNRAFPRALVIGAGPWFARALEQRPQVRAKIGTMLAADSAAALLQRPLSFACDPEALPLRDESFDLIVNVLTLHHVNDAPGVLIQMRRALKPDGLFLGALLGAGTLEDLRHALLEAELEAAGGACARIHPFADARDVGGLLQRAGFALPVVDRDDIPVRYREPLRLFADLRAMGETSALADRPEKPLTREILAAALARLPNDADGRFPMRFTILTATGWAPHESQQQPLKPGSAQMRLADALGVQERKLDD